MYDAFGKKRTNTVENYVLLLLFFFFFFLASPQAFVAKYPPHAAAF